MSALLEIQDLDLFDGDAQALDGVSLQAEAGRSWRSWARTAPGSRASSARWLASRRRAEARYATAAGTSAACPAMRFCELGIGQVAAGRQVFPTLTVRENLEVGAMVARARPRLKDTLAEMYALFPRLAERSAQLAGTLSGGEQQMLAIARCLMALPEWSCSTSRRSVSHRTIVHEVFQTVLRLHHKGLTIILVEQNVAVSLKLAHTAYVLENGRIVMRGWGAELLADDRVRQAYLGL